MTSYSTVILHLYQYSHGASVADLDENSMFYLAARGIDRRVRALDVLLTLLNSFYRQLLIILLNASNMLIKEEHCIQTSHSNLPSIHYRRLVSYSSLASCWSSWTVSSWYVRALPHFSLPLHYTSEHEPKYYLHTAHY